MTEEANVQNTDPGAETTPEVTDNSQGITAPVEGVASTEPVGTVAPKETPGETEARQADRQKRYEDALSRLDDADPSGRLKAIATGQEPALPPATEEGEAIETVADMTPQQLQAMFQGAVAQANYQDQSRQEYNQTDKVIRDFCAANSITPEEHGSIMAEVSTMVDVRAGRPSQVGRAFLKVAQLRALQNRGVQQTDAVRAAAAGKVEALRQTEQPSGATPVTPQEKSEQMKFLDEMRKAGSSEASEEFWRKG